MEYKKKIKLYPHHKYKWFKSSIKYALDWEDCKKLIPIKDVNVSNTLKYMFYKFKTGIFIEIRNNKIYKFVPFYNIKFKNNWSHKIDIDLKNFINKYYKKDKKYIEYDKKKWTALNCKIKFKNINSTEEEYYQFKYFLEKILKYKKIKNCKFFYNKKDYPLLTRKGIEPYHHIYGENIKLTSHNYKSYSPILSYGQRLNIFQDILIPTDNCLDIIYQLKFPPNYENTFLDDGLKQVFNKNIPSSKIIRGCQWKNKKETCIWRGKGTGCSSDFNNPRLLITKINQEWKNDKLLKNYLDAGIVSTGYKPSKFINNKSLHIIDLNKLKIKKLNKIPMKEQMKYKYILDIEGNASAYRLGYLLSFKSVLLKVNSEYKIWIDYFMKPYEHYIPIKRDFSNLGIVIKWCIEHDKTCEKIANNAFELFRKCYNEKFMIDYVSKKLNKLKPMKFS